MKRLPLIRHEAVIAHTLVDDADFVRFSAYRWGALTSRGGKMAAVRWRHRPGTKDRTDAVFLHREIVGPVPPGMQVDHRDGDSLNNQRGNLRIVTPSGNGANRTGPQRNNSSARFRGVWWEARRGKWRTGVGINGRNYHVGYFDNEEEAGAAVAAFRRQHMPTSEMDRV